MSIRRLILLLVAATCAQLAAAQLRRQPLVRQLRSAANALELGLVYSPGMVPDTALSRVTGLHRLDSLTQPFGLTYAIIGEQLVISRRPSRPYSVSGYLEDAVTGERLIGATVVVSGEGRGAVTNGYGFFVVSDLLPHDSLDYRYVGYPSVRLAVPGPSRPDEGIVVRLRPSVSLGVVEVTASAAPESRVLAGTPRPLPAEALERSELVTGDRDVNAFLGLIPGVQSAPGGFGGYSVRGADPSQNLVLLDDATLYLPSHAAGYISAVPGGAVRSLQLYKDGGPARFGDRVGAVLDLRLKEGTRAGHELTPTVSLTDVGLAAEGPLGEGSYIVSGRNSITGQWLNILRGLGVGDLPDIRLDFFDVTAKVNYPIGVGQRVYASVFVGGDRYDDAASSSIDDGLGVTSYRDASQRSATNAIVSLRHATSFGARWFVNTTLTLSQFDFLADDVLRVVERPLDSEPAFTFTEDLFQTNLLDLGARQDYSFALRPDTRLQFGIGAVSHRFRVGTATESGLRLEQPDSTQISRLPQDSLPQLLSYDVSLYGGVVFEPSQRWRIEAGLRLASQVGLRQPFVALLPRFSASYELSAEHGIDFGFGETRQFIHRVSTRNPGLPREVYLPTIGRLQPQEARYASIGWRYTSATGFAASAGVYGRDMDGLARFDNRFEGRGLSNWASNVRRGDGWATGLEVEAVAPFGKTTLLGTYTWAYTERTFENDSGDPLPAERFRLDRRHFGTLTWRQRLGLNWEASATLRIGSGLPVRIPTVSEVAPPLPTGAVPLTNTYDYDGPFVTLPLYHSLDLGARYRIEGEGAVWRLAFGIQNAYVNTNPLFLSLRAVPQSDEGGASFTATQVLLLPVLPFARLSATLKYASRPPDSDPRGTSRGERL